MRMGVHVVRMGRGEVHSVCGRIILEWILNVFGRSYTGLIWLRLGRNVGLL